MSLFSTDPNELERRKKVWIAISDLWLDTGLQTYGLDYIARVLAESGYTDKELHHIYLYEVAPVVYTHLLTPVSPVWAGFSPQWLCPEIDHTKRTRIDCLLNSVLKKNE